MHLPIRNLSLALFLEDCMLVEMHSYSVVMLPFATDAATWYSLFAAHLRKY